MTEPEMRKQALEWVAEAKAAGARQERICEVIGICSRSVQRWKKSPSDKRPDATRPKPCHALSTEEKAEVLVVLNQKEYASLPPSQIAAIRKPSISLVKHSEIAIWRHAPP